MRLINVIGRFLCDISSNLITPRIFVVASSNFITEKGLRVSVYKPYLEKELEKVVLYYHGGGWVLGSIKAYDRVLRFLSLNGNCVVVGVDYRKAPEHKFPAAIDDAYDSYKWAMNNIDLLKEKPENLVVCGDSAGGNLAINLFKRLHEKGENALFKFILIYPLLGTVNKGIDD